MSRGRRPQRPHRPVSLAPKEQSILDDFLALMLDALKLRAHLLDPRSRFDGHVLTDEQIELDRPDRGAALLELDIALLPLAQAVRPPLSKGSSLMAILRRDADPVGVLPPGAYAVQSSAARVRGIEELWECAVTWTVRLVGDSHDRVTAVEEIGIALHELDVLGQLVNKVPRDLNELQEVLAPQTSKKRKRGRSFAIRRLAAVSGVSEDTVSAVMTRLEARLEPDHDVDLTTVQEQVAQTFLGVERAAKQQQAKRDAALARLKLSW